MYTYRIRRFSLAIVLAMVVCVSSLNSVAPVHAADTFSTKEIEDICSQDYAFAEDRVLVILSNEASLQFNKYSSSDFREIDCLRVNDLTKVSAEKVKNECERISAMDIDGRKSVDTTTLQKYNQIVCLELAEPGRDNVFEAINALQKREDVVYAGPDYLIHTCATTPNDSDYSSQTAAEIIHLPEAWDISTGSSEVFVGIIDSGIDGYHTDINDEFNGRSNINGQKSRYFVNGDIIEEVHPIDCQDHGTHVAGIIGAVGNNGNGISGVCWNVQLVSLRALDADGYGYASDVVNAIEYAEGANIPILNLSLGYYNSSDHYDEVMNTAIQNFSGLVICAAGNDEHNIDLVQFYPGSYSNSNIITVGNSTNSDTKAEGSNYGRTSVDLFAPGEYVYSTYPGNGYASKSGTSMSTPFVTGVAALILADNPDLLPCEIKDSILSNVDDCGTAFNNQCVTGGRLNAYKALKYIKRHTSNYEYEDLGYSNGHMVTCSSCGSSGVRAHKFTNPSQYNTQKHAASCNCGNTIYEPHTWNAMKTKCLVCGFNISGSVMMRDP